MPSLIDKFLELERLIKEQHHTLHLHAGVPFVLLIYDPDQERLCQEEQEHLRMKLADDGFVVRDIPVETFIFDHYEQIGLLEKIFEMEATEPRTVYRDLAKNFRPTLAKHIIEAATELADHPRAVLFLSRVAHLYPFVRVSNLLENLENRVRLPLVVFYPGEAVDGELRFLGLENADGPHTKYRARRI